MNVPLISVVLPTYNRAEMLPAALRALCDQQCDGQFSYEVVVIDNGSADSTQSIVQGMADRHPSIVRHALETTPGVANARNRGLEVARGEWLAFCDDDEIPSPHWLAELHRVATEYDAPCVGGVVRLDLSESRFAEFGPDARRALRERDENVYGSTERRFVGREYAGTDNMLVHRSVFDKVGTFDTTMKNGGSDFDFSIRARRAGFETWLAPKAEVLHRVSGNRLTPEFFRWDALQCGALLAYFDAKYKGIPKSLCYLVGRFGQATLVTVPRLGIAILTGNQREIADRKIRLYRFRGYIHRLLTMIAPRLFREQSLLRHIEFRKGRIVGSVATSKDGSQ